LTVSANTPGSLVESTCLALTLSSVRLNDAAQTVVTMAAENGSTTPASTRFIHFNNATARAVDAAELPALEVVSDG
jgi:hypothetical protein